jgi:hypothetical protein
MEHDVAESVIRELKQQAALANGRITDDKKFWCQKQAQL